MVGYHCWGPTVYLGSMVFTPFYQPHIASKRPVSAGFGKNVPYMLCFKTSENYCIQGVYNMWVTGQLLSQHIGDDIVSKSERFALIAGIVGFVADIITLSTFFMLWMGGIDGAQAPGYAPFSIRIVVIFSLVYSWFVICWILTRRSYSLFRERTSRTVKWADWSTLRFAHSRAFGQYTVGTVFGIAILFSPFVFFLVQSWLADPNVTTVGVVLLTVLCDGMVGMIICLALVLGMPVVYADMEIDLFFVLSLLKPWH